jgi:hypothetical protein
LGVYPYCTFLSWDMWGVTPVMLESYVFLLDRSFTPALITHQNNVVS